MKVHEIEDKIGKKLAYKILPLLVKNAGGLSNGYCTGISCILVKNDKSIYFEIKEFLLPHIGDSEIPAEEVGNWIKYLYNKNNFAKDLDNIMTELYTEYELSNDINYQLKITYRNVEYGVMEQKCCVTLDL